MIHPHPKYLLNTPPGRVPPVCAYCRRRAELMKSEAVYGAGHNYGAMWVCTKCEAWVGCHKNSSDYAPLGRLANASLRRLKMRVHAELDPWWRDLPGDGSRNHRRKEVYRLLAEEMRIPPRECHVADMDEARCQHAMDVLCSERWRVLAAAAITHTANET